MSRASKQSLDTKDKDKDDNQFEELGRLSGDNSIDEDTFIASDGTRQRRKGLNLDQDEFADLIKIRQKLRRDDSDDDLPMKSEKKGQPIGLILVAAFFALLVLAHIAAASYLFATPSKYEHPHECLTANCKRMSKWLKDAMNPKVDPCENFHEYACGSFLKKQSSAEPTFIIDGIPYQYEGNERLGKFLQPYNVYPLNQLLPFYHSCIFQRRRDSQGYDRLVKLFADLKLLHLDPGKETPSVARLISRIYKKTKKMFLLSVYDILDNFARIRLELVEKEASDANPKDYATAMKQTFQLLKKELFIDEEEIDTIVYLVMRFEAESIVLQSRSSGVKFLFGFPHKMSQYIKIPENLHPNFNTRGVTFHWDDFVNELFGNATGQQPVVLFNYYESLEKYERFNILQMEQLLRETPYYVFLRYFQWSLIKLYAFDLTSELQNIMKKIHVSKGNNQAELCFRSTFTHLSALATSRYAMDIQDSKNNEEKVKNWMHLTKSHIIKLMKEKLPPVLSKLVVESLKRVIYVEINIQKISHLMPTFYQGLKMSDVYYFDNVLRAQKIKARNDIYKMLKVPSFDQWPSIRNSLSDLMQNEVGANEGGLLRMMNIPFGVVDEPFFGHDLPIMNMAGLGFWLSCFYSMRYPVNDMISEYTNDRHIHLGSKAPIHLRRAVEIISRLNCIYSELSHLEHSYVPGIKLNPFSSRSNVDNIADVMGVEIITKIVEAVKDDRSIFPEYQILPGFEHYSPDQLLFHTIARQSCRSNSKSQIKYLLKNGPTPYQLRINGAFRMVEAFAREWKCSKTSFMNPPNKCEFFKSFNASYIPYNKAYLT